MMSPISWCGLRLKGEQKPVIREEINSLCDPLNLAVAIFQHL